MTPDGIATRDWDQVHELALEVVNTSAQGEDAASASATERLLELLDRLQEKYGPLPSLLATRADYVESPEDRENCLLAAFEQAEQRGDSKNQIFISESLAFFYIEERHDRDQGARWLDILVGHLGPSSDGWEAESAVQLRAILGEMK